MKRRSRGDRHAEIATAPKFAHLFTSSASSRFLQKTLAPRMRENKMIEAIISAAGEIRAVLENKRRIEKPKSAFLKYFLIGLIALILGWIGYVHIKVHLCKECGHWVHIETVVKQEATYFSTGLEELYFTCDNCGMHYKETRVIPERSSGSSSNDSSSDSDSDSGGSSDGGGGADW